MIKFKQAIQDKITMLWYLTDDKCAVCSEIEKNDWEGCYEITFKGKTIGGFKTKREAVAQCKKILKHYFYTGKVQLWI